MILRRECDALKRHFSDVCGQLNNTALSLLTCFPRLTQNSHYRISQMASEDPRYGFLVALFKSSCVRHRRDYRSVELCEAPRLEISKIEDVINPRLVRAYLAKLDDIEALRCKQGCSLIVALKHLMLPAPFDAVGVNEAILFHGAKPEDVNSICKGGLDPRRGGEHGGHLFGFAAYLTPNASKADIYTDNLKDSKRRSRTSKRQVIVVRALLGQSYRALTPMQNILRPPDDENGIPFDSMWADVRGNGGAVDHLECMVYRESQTIPIAIITYSHQPQCKCSECCKRPD